MAKTTPNGAMKSQPIAERRRRARTTAARGFGGASVEVVICESLPGAGRADPWRGSARFLCLLGDGEALLGGVVDELLLKVVGRLRAGLLTVVHRRQLFGEGGVV